MKSTNQYSYAEQYEAQVTAKSLRALYFTRVGFSILWIILVITMAKTSSALAMVLFVLYPAWDAVATYIDIKANSALTNKSPQYINLGISIITAIVVAVALQSGISQTLVVFGAWASLTGLIQLILGLRRRKQFEGQWPMIISGAQSMLAGGFIIATAHAPNQGIASLAGYSAFGAFYFALAAIRLGKTIKSANITA